MPDLQACERILRNVPMGRRAGVLTQVVGLTVACRGLVSALGDLCRIEVPEGGDMLAEVVGFRAGDSLLMPLCEPEGLRPGARVVPLGRRLGVNCGHFLLGRVLDSLGRPLDDRGPLPTGVQVPMHRAAPTPLERVSITTPLQTGISVLDGLLTLGRGQRLGIFAGSGVGKSTLLADIAREALADVNVIALVGERGREVRAFIEEALGEEGLARSVIVVATSDAPPLLRIKAAFAAVAIAEWFRDHGNDVMFMLDSITRLAGAQREVGLALGEPPTVKGYPPSFFSTVPRLVERLGRTQRGSITGLFTVLVDGDDMNDPVADTLRGLLDGHVVLSRRTAQHGIFPAVDVLQNTSRISPRITSREQQTAAREIRRLLSDYEEVRDLVAVGAWKEGSDPKVDRAVRSINDVEAFLSQESGQARSFDETVTRMISLSEGAAR